MLHSIMLFGVSAAAAKDAAIGPAQLKGIADVLVGAGLLVCLVALMVAAAMKVLATTDGGEPNPAVNQMLMSSMVGVVLGAFAYAIVDWLT
jgi:hypothetical protein